MSCRDEGLCYGGLWLMFAACGPLRPKVEARWRFVEVGPCGLNCHKPKPNSTRYMIPSATDFDIYIYIYILGLRLSVAVCV